MVSGNGPGKNEERRRRRHKKKKKVKTCRKERETFPVRLPTGNNGGGSSLSQACEQATAEAMGVKKRVDGVAQL